MADEETLTPEEKLLRVIQKGDSQERGSSGETVKPDNEAAAPAAADPVPMAPAAASEGKGLVACNRILALAACVFLVLAGHQTYLNLPAQAHAYAPEDLVVAAVEATHMPPSLSDTLDMFARRRVFGHPPPVDDGTGQTVTNIVNLIGWRAYARENLSLIGMSDVRQRQDGIEQIRREAIVMDNKRKKMHFLSAGQSLELAEREVQVAHVGESVVELKLGEETLTIE